MCTFVCVYIYVLHRIIAEMFYILDLSTMFEVALKYIINILYTNPALKLQYNFNFNLTLLALGLRTYLG